MGYLKLLDSTNFEIKQGIKQNNDRINNIEEIYENNYCFVGSSDRTVKLFNLEKMSCIENRIAGSEVLSGDTNGYVYFSGLQNGCVKLWTRNDKNSIGEVKIHTSPVNFLKISSCENYIMSCSVNDEICVVDRRTSKTINYLDIFDKVSKKQKISIGMENDFNRVFLGLKTGNIQTIDLTESQVVEKQLIVNHHDSPIQFTYYNSFADFIIAIFEDGNFQIIRQNIILHN